MSWNRFDARITQRAERELAITDEYGIRNVIIVIIKARDQYCVNKFENKCAMYSYIVYDILDMYITQLF